MKFLLFSLLLFSLSLVAQGDKKCSFSHENSKSTLGWTAYKTPDKIGVGGSFDKFHITSFPNPSLKGFLESLQFNIDSRTVNTKNTGRDAKLYKFFFSQFSPTSFIKGSVLTVVPKDKTTGEITALFSLNGVQKEEKLSYTYNKKERLIEIKGRIDVLNYTLSKPLKALNKACYSLHKGKTWSEVAISAKLKMVPCFQF